MRSNAARTALLVLALLSGACTTTAHYGGDRIAHKDPLEKFNRKVYKVDRALDKAIVRPAAVVYTKVVPEAGRRGIHNFFNNAEEPRNFVNAVLQGKPKVALQTLARFIINTTLGVGGFADHATGFGLPEHKEDFGQTFAVWGIGSGPYLVLPVLGPSTLRDAAGRGIEFAGGDPFDYAIGRLHLRWYVKYPGITLPRLLDVRAELLDTADKLLNGSADEYATVRSAYLQSRRNDIYDGNPPDDDPADSPADMAASPTPSPPPTAMPDSPLNVDPGAPQPAPPSTPSGDQALNLDPGALRPALDPSVPAPALNTDFGPPVAAGANIAQPASSQ
jgi:phospholipid-binding lipoprotein MlaA